MFEKSIFLQHIYDPGVCWEQLTVFPIIKQESGGNKKSVRLVPSAAGGRGGASEVLPQVGLLDVQPPRRRRSVPLWPTKQEVPKLPERGPMLIKKGTKGNLDQARV